MWMAWHTQEEIAEVLNCPRETIRDKIKDFGEIGNLAKSAKPQSEHNDGISEDGEPIWKPPIYNV